MKEKILKVLENIEYLYNVSFEETKLYQGEGYWLIFKSTMEYKELEIKLKICIPRDWDRKLIDIYIVNFMDIPYIPHLDNKRKIMFVSVRRYSY